jgi:hypothetical protein
MWSLREWVQTRHEHRRLLLESLADETFSYELHHPYDGDGSGGAIDKLRQDLLLRGRGWEHAGNGTAVHASDEGPADVTRYLSFVAEEGLEGVPARPRPS